MKLATVFLAALVLSGCARWNERFHGSWLEDVGKPAEPPVVLADDAAASLGAEIVQLRQESERIRIQLAAEPDRVRRMAYLRELREIGNRLRPIEQLLRDARRPLPPTTPHTSSPVPVTAAQPARAS